MCHKKCCSSPYYSRILDHVTHFIQNGIFTRCNKLQQFEAKRIVMVFLCDTKRSNKSLQKLIEFIFLFENEEIENIEIIVCRLQV